MEEIRFRRAVAEDRDRIMEIIREARERMRRAGSDQWQRPYPAAEHIVADLERGCGYVLEEQGTVVAYGALLFDGEPAYEALRGCWIGTPLYAVVHRFAEADDRLRQGMATRFMRESEALARRCGMRSMRVDTNFDNAGMLRLLAGSGYTFCGEVRYAHGSRRAYEKLLG